MSVSLSVRERVAALEQQRRETPTSSLRPPITKAMDVAQRTLTPSPTPSAMSTSRSDMSSPTPSRMSTTPSPTPDLSFDNLTNKELEDFQDFMIDMMIEKAKRQYPKNHIIHGIIQEKTYRPEEHGIRLKIQNPEGAFNQSIYRLLQWEVPSTNRPTSTPPSRHPIEESPLRSIGDLIYGVKTQNIFLTIQ